jgi:SAM-dependent methyltransferase
MATFATDQKSKQNYSSGLCVAKAAGSSASDVHDFWDVEACGSHAVRAERGTAEFYEQYRTFRYNAEWHLPLLVPFAETGGSEVLEIGCGNGSDGAMFALAGARYTGVDLTEAAIEASRGHFHALNLSGRFHIENAEKLSFADESFDFVYSHGVLHHTPQPDTAFSEVYRVLRPGGKAVLMLYHKRSFNYYVRILGYMRARVLLHILLRAPRHKVDRANLGARLLHVRGNDNALVWRAHYENFLRKGWSYLFARNFVHHATDGPECPFAYVYTSKMVGHLFRRFRSVQTRTAHFPLRRYPGLKWLPFSVEKRLASKMGWYLFVYLTK